MSATGQRRTRARCHAPPSDTPQPPPPTLNALPRLATTVPPSSPSPSPLPRSYLGKVAFGEALRSNAEVSAVFGVQDYPTLLVVCGGNRDVVIKYEGARLLCCGKCTVAAMWPWCGGCEGRR